VACVEGDVDGGGGPRRDLVRDLGVEGEGACLRFEAAGLVGDRHGALPGLRWDGEAELELRGRPERGERPRLLPQHGPRRAEVNVRLEDVGGGEAAALDRLGVERLGDVEVPLVPGGPCAFERPLARRRGRRRGVAHRGGRGGRARAGAGARGVAGLVLRGREGRRHEDHGREPGGDAERRGARREGGQEGRELRRRLRRGRRGRGAATFHVYQPKSIGPPHPAQAGGQATGTAAPGARAGSRTETAPSASPGTAAAARGPPGTRREGRPGRG